MIAGGLERRTANTITDPELFRTNLAEIRKRGYSRGLVGVPRPLARVAASDLRSIGAKRQRNMEVDR